MKRLISITVIPFLIAFTINIILGITRDSVKIGLTLWRAILTTLITVIVITSIHWIIKKFLPELLIPLSESGDEGSDTFEEEHSLDVAPAVKETGNKVDLVLNDNFFTENNYRDFSAKSDDTDEIQDQLRASHASSTPETGIFTKEDPRILAQAVRTTMSRDDS
ncbi:hypothetical protein PVA45_06370 [Entomospira entomophila]|uniref:Uncharacterized protein n=1 Tax=Entomospira entomophila TaxID=2719988 RepID=A0A968GCJ1_9SPIO|nr:hypothetical protein [Entomospira entomophilus]NIZ41123.1 hypothetical protein [Entomospira entomophilus]WDI35330.1 hypothetical protein PVA45_06370 [Entomospira entomophilus]